MRSGGQYYAVYKEIGSGAFGKVKLIQNQETKALAIRKGIDLASENTRDSRLATGREEQINLEDTGQSLGEMSLRKADERSKKNRNFYTTSGGKERGGDQVVLTMALEPGEQGYEHFVKDNRLSTRLSTAEILQAGLSFLSAYKTRYQDNDLINRDIKPDNAVFDEVTCTWAFVDAGPAIHESVADAELSMSGTPGFIAPEAKLRKWSRKADVYSLGFSLAEIYDLKKGISFKSKIKTAEESEDNDYFHDKALRTEIINYLKLMTDEDPNKRPSVEEAMKFFEEKLKDFPEIVKTRRVAIFDINEYENAHGPDRKNMLSALSQASEVWMLDRSNPPKSDEDIGILQAELRSAGVRVGSSVFTASGLEVKAGIEGIIELNKQKNDGVVRGLYFVTNKNAAVSLDKHKIHVVKADTSDEKEIEKRYEASFVHVSKDVIDRINNALTKELGRLEERYGEKGQKNEIAKERYQKITEYQKSLLKNSSVSFVQMEKELAKLANEMKTTGYFMSVSKGAKKINRLNASLDKDYRQERMSLMLNVGKT
jgi:serine/threonine protein kinase